MKILSNTETKSNSGCKCETSENLAGLKNIHYKTMCIIYERDDTYNF